MLLLRLQWFIKRVWYICFFKLVYRHKISIPWSCRIRFGFNIVIDDNSAVVEIGKNVHFNNYCSLNALCKIKIGDNTIIGENVKMYDHNHKYKDNKLLIVNQGFTCGPIIIGNNCWIGSNVTILKGVTIGDNCVIGAGCIVFKDIPSNTLLINKQDLIYKSINLNTNCDR
ncbi:MAG: acyltransferase [Bacteroidales bacterium]|nr:acyltransferase [Bacteroidales bacterium]